MHHLQTTTTSTACNFILRISQAGLLASSIARTTYRNIHLSQRLQDRLLQTLRLRSRSPPVQNLSILANQELFKVPLDSLHAHETWHLLLQILEYRFCLVAVDVRLTEDGERDAVVELAKLLDGVVVSGVLVAELVAGEA